MRPAELPYVQPRFDRKAPRITAVVVTFQGSPYVSGCLASLLSAVANPASMRVMVVDNASSDGTVAILRREFPDIDVLRSDTNVGYGAACNRAVAESNSDYVAVVNQDVVSKPGWIDRLVEVLEHSPQLALATPKILVKDDPGRINACGNAPHYTGITACRGYNRPHAAFDRIEHILAVSGAAFVVRRSAFESVGGFDASFFLYFEDTDLSLRLRLAGYGCVYVPEAIVLHEFEPTFSARKIRLLEQNRQACWLKLFRWRTLLVLSPALLLTELSVWAYCLSRGPKWLAAKTQSYAGLAMRLPLIRRQRSAVRRIRRVPDADVLVDCSDRLDVGELNQGSSGLLQVAVNWMLAWWYARVLRVVQW